MTGRVSNKPHLFICHASEDKEFVRHFVKMVNQLGVVNRDDMTCTSVDEYKVRLGEKWLDAIHERLKNPRVIVVFIHSSNLYKSPFAMNEMGAVWINGRQNFSFLVNGFPYSSMKGVVTRLDQCAKVGEDGFAQALDDFRELLQEKMSLSPISVEEWERIKNEFVVAVTSLPKDNLLDQVIVDLNETYSIHIRKVLNLFADKYEDSIQNVSLADILKIVAPTMEEPHTRSALEDCFNDVYEGIEPKDVERLIISLYQKGLIGCEHVNREDYLGEAWFLTTVGRSTYYNLSHSILTSEMSAGDKNIVSQLLSQFSTRLMDEYIAQGPDLISMDLITSMDVWLTMIYGSGFVIHNEDLKLVLMDFFCCWAGLMQKNTCYESSGNFLLLKRDNGNNESLAYIRELEDEHSKLATLYRRFIDFVKHAYPDFDLIKFSQEFERSCRVSLDTRNDNHKDDNVIKSFSEVIKELLDTPNSRIRLEETIETEVSKLKAELENVPSIKGNVDVSLYKKINTIYLPIVSPIVEGLVSLIRWGNDYLYNQVIQVVTNIANHQKSIYGHNWEDLELRMNYMFVPHCIYALLTACVLYKKYRLLDLLMRIKCKNPYGKETWIIESYSDGYISDVDAQKIFNCQQTCTLALYTSRLLEDIHQMYFKRKEKDEVMTAFCFAEMLGCLYYVDMVESSALRETDVYTPGGLFTFKYFSRQGMLSGNKAFDAMLKDIDEQKSIHPIFKAGVLDGDYEKYKTLFTLAVPDFRRKTMGL